MNSIPANGTQSSSLSQFLPKLLLGIIKINGVKKSRKTQFIFIKIDADIAK